MSDLANYEQYDLPEDTKCYDCVYRLSQVCLPLDAEEFGVENGTTVVVHMCVLMDADIASQITLECTKYESTGQHPYLMGHKFLR